MDLIKDFEVLLEDGKMLLSSPHCPPEVINKVQELLDQDLNIVLREWTGLTLYRWLCNNHEFFFKNLALAKRNFFLKLPRYRIYLWLLEDISSLYKISLIND